MIFLEKKEKELFIYNVTDVFGEMEFKSPDKLSAEQLDAIFFAIFNIKSNTEIIEGTVAGTGISYWFKKIKQWDNINEKEETPIIVKTNLLNKILWKIKKLLRRFIH